MSEKKISMVDIARMAEVSTATISRVLNKNGRYSPETEKRVMEIVHKYGYLPNLSAKTLRTNKSLSIGVIVPDITNEFFGKIVRSIENTVLPFGYSVFVCDSHEDEEIETLHIQNIVSKNVDGVIYIAGRADVGDIDQNFSMPVVYIDRQAEQGQCVGQSDNEYGGFLATEQLIRSGCRRILLLRDRRMLFPVRQRYEGYCKAHEKYGIPMDESLIVDSTVDYTLARDTISMILEEESLFFDGVFATNDMMALGALHALQKHHVRVPEQMKLVGFDDISLSEFCNPPITTITQDTEAMGQRAARLLLKRIQGGSVPSNNIMLPVFLNKRGTT